MASYQNGSSNGASNGASNGTSNGYGAANGSKYVSSTSSLGPGERLASKSHPKPTPLNLKPTSATRQGVANTFERYGQVLRATVEPLPTQVGGGTFSENKKWGKLRTDLMTLRSADFRTLRKMVVAKIKGEKIADDKTMLMERVIQLVSNLPSNSKLRVELTNDFIKQLWDSLEHPPSLYVGDKFQFRQADGSYNNIMFPQLGAAGTFYARSVRPNVIRQGALPDPALIYDSVMKRTEYKPHPNNVSSILWYWASIIIHDLFWTDYRDMNKSKTSSYLDLSPLYGSNQEMQDTIRTFKDGKLKPDCFADKRLLGMPPGVGVLLIQFNRFHNYVAENLVAINEDGKFMPPAATLEGERAAAAWKKYDNDIFQTARLVTSGLYINITLLDYVRNIVNLNRVDTTWTLDPRQDSGIDAGTNEGAVRGTGNVVSAEFNLCYRWHSCISDKDDKWIQDFYYELFQKPGSEISVQELIMGFGKFESRIPEDPLDRPFNNFKRGADGKFNDDDLVECITSGIEDPAGSFGARNVPGSMRAIEILGIIQGRKWNTAGLNEFRKHFGLKPYETFEDINSDPGVAESLRHLYDHPDFVELYPGLVAEEHKVPMVPGVGIAPTYTISRVVLSDAVCLVRGDRHYTIDYNPRNLTNWGYTEAQYDLNINHGCVFYKLFIRAFPNHFKNNSVYAHYPMVIPSENEKILKDLKRAHLFDFTRPSRISPPSEVITYGGAKQVFGNQEAYSVSWHRSVESLLGENWLGAGKAPFSRGSGAHDSHRQNIHQQLQGNGDWMTNVKNFFRETTNRLLTENSYTVAGYRLVDVVRDVGNLAPVHFASRVFNLPLNTKATPKGIYTDHELYAVLAVIFTAIFYDVDPVKSFPLREAAKTVLTQLGSAIESSVKSSKGLFASGPSKTDRLAGYGAELVKQLTNAGLSNQHIAWGQVLPTAVAIVPSQAETFAQAVDFYLSPKGAPYLADIQVLAAQPASAEADSLLLGYALEGVRLSGTLGVFREASADGAIKEDDGSEVSVRAKDRVFVSTAHATKDATHFPDPEIVNPHRPVDSYIHHAASAHSYFDDAVGHAALTEMFRALFRRKNVRRAPGPQGELKKVTREGGAVFYLREDWGALTPFPVTMKVMWDEE
ncbi:heme peroxidase [Podospora appendiculata]|uniref:Heme peroxidase n=1 Tax=Podospora appendiculata TaxID=314037 RepID=A0AAE1CDF2_9PEZI|nr:heme peroxidase [Podospora appendiculata]